MASSSSSSFHGDFYSRKLLLFTPLFPHHHPSSPPASAAPQPSVAGDDSVTSFDANVFLILFVFFCSAIFSLTLNFLVKCAVSCSGRLANSQGSSEKVVTNTGVSKKALKTFSVVSYSAELTQTLPGLDAECAICLSDFAAGDKVRLLPKCNHGFHVKCIDKWLGSHSSCPKCRQCLIEQCQKIAGCDSAAPPPPPPVEERVVVVSIAPLEPEGLIRDYRERS